MPRAPGPRNCAQWASVAKASPQKTPASAKREKIRFMVRGACSSPRVRASRVNLPPSGGANSPQPEKGLSPDPSGFTCPVRAPGVNGEFYLAKLAELNAGLHQTIAGSTPFFAGPLNIVQEAMGFTLSVLYRVENVVDRTLILEVAGVLDPAGRRPALVRGARLAIDLDRPEPAFRNEADAFIGRGVAAVNVPGAGCDIAGYIAAGEMVSDAYLLAGDFVGAEADLRETDRRVFDIATGLLSALLLKAHFQHRANHDRLTGLMSSARIRAELEHALQRRGHQPARALAVALADVDQFKRINDVHGHLRGDAVLEKLGQLVASGLRAGQDHAGRFGGEEFLIILEDTSPEAARAILERLRAAVERQPFVAAGPDGRPQLSLTLPVTLSIGACLFAAGDLIPDATQALAAADRALYTAKHAGRNRLIALCLEDTRGLTILSP
ncbi:MAG: GGDEF domain-containing protein [Opitutus sp.]|nr:GGDEF domain-containing protein [Opitutus sp.]